MAIPNKINVTVITGFLGAGKTTFINALLTNYPQTQFALVENEFGDTSIDTKLIKGVDASQMFELKQGCICCTITDEYELVLEELAKRFPTVEHLLIETTGVAEPAGVIRPFFFNQSIKKLYSFNGVICLVDGKNYNLSLEKELAQKQIVVADYIAITKTENCEQSKKQEIESELMMINPFAKTGFSNFGKTEGFDLFLLQNKKRNEFDYVGINNTKSAISAKTFSAGLLPDKSDFEERLFYQLDIYKNQIYRIKGLVCFENEPYKFVVQGVGGSYILEESSILNTDNKSNLVFIGKLENIQLTFPFSVE